MDFEIQYIFEPLSQNNLHDTAFLVHNFHWMLPLYSTWLTFSTKSFFIWFSTADISPKSRWDS